MAPKFSECLQWCKTELGGASKGYMSTFDYRESTDPRAKKVEDPSYYKQFIAFIDSDLPIRSNGPADGVKAAEDKCTAKLRELSAKIDEISLHWQMRDHAWKELHNNHERPAPRTLYIHSDWKDRPTY